MSHIQIIIENYDKEKRNLRMKFKDINKFFFALLIVFASLWGLNSISNKIFQMDSIDFMGKEEIYAKALVEAERLKRLHDEVNKDLLLVERTVTHTVLGRSELKNKIKEKEELAKETKTMTTLEGIKSEIRILENELKNIIVSKSHKILGRGDIQRRIDRKEKEISILRAISSTFAENIDTSEIAMASNTTTNQEINLEEKPKLTFEQMLASASVDKGKKVSMKCTACHGFELNGQNRIGPNLWAILNTEKASKENFKYSNSLKSLGGNWTIEDINLYLKSPRKYAPGNAMAFAGLRKDKDRANLIAYLNSLSENPLSLVGAD